MTTSSLQLLIALFDEEDAARRALLELNRAQKARLIAVQDAALILHDQQDRLQITEFNDLGPRRGALVGAIVGAIVGLLGGPAGAIVAGAAGAVVGGVTASVIDSGIPDRRLEEIAHSLTSGASAIVLVVEHTWLKKVARQMTKAGADVLIEPLPAGISQ